jgi:GDP-L-fucose synthase
MKILITGYFGFVGRNFTRRLLADGHDIVGVDPVFEAVPWLQLAPPKQLNCVVDDIRRYISLQPCDQFDLIIHCAANVGGRLNIDGDPMGVATNLSIDSQLFNWVCKAKNRPRLIYFSSSAIYPPELQTRTKHVALAENLVDLSANRFALPETTYGFAKFAGEYLAKCAVEKYGAEVAVYRPFGGYGEDQDLTYPFPSIINRVVRIKNPIKIWGSGDQERDFIHIDDIVDAVLSTYERVLDARPLNLGTGYGINFKRLAELACILAEHWGSIEPDPTKPEGVFSRVADTYRLNQFYKPKISLAQGIERALTAAKR